MKTFNLSFIILLSLFSTQLFSQIEEKLNDKKNEVSLEENKGQMKDQNWKSRQDVLYSGSSEGMNFFIRNSGISYQLSRVESWKEEEEMLHTSLGSDDKKRHVPDQIGTYRVDAEWINANQDFSINQGIALEGYNNYYNVPEGVEPALFVKKYESLTLKNVWNGVDIHYYGNGGFLETDYIVVPGADYKQIQIDIKGAVLSKDDQGNLIIKTPFGEIREGQLKVYQNNVLIEAYWKIEGNRVSFDIPKYNPDLGMRIDPLTRIWGTYYGGATWGSGLDIKTDNYDNVFMSGVTNSSFGIATQGSYQGVINGSCDAYLVKFNDIGTRIWATYCGGNREDYGRGIGVDASSNIFLTGSTRSSYNIATSPSHQTVLGDTTGGDAFLIKFNQFGIRQWGTYFGGSFNDYAFDVTCDSSNQVIIVGQTSSYNGISTIGSHQSNFGGTAYSSGFITKFNTTGNVLWSSYYGGASGCGESIDDVCTDQNNNIYFIGEGGSNTLISTIGCHQYIAGGGTDVFLVKFNPFGVRQWGTYLAGSGTDIARGICLDSSEGIYITGSTSSSNNMATVGAFQTVCVSQDVFIAKFNNSGIRIWSTYLGGTNSQECGTALNCDNSNNIYITGFTNGSSSISTIGSFQPIYAGGLFDCFLVKFNSIGARIWGTYYGGQTWDDPESISIDNSNSIYICGSTDSPTGIATIGSYQDNYIGSQDDCNSFLAKFNECLAIPIVIQSGPIIFCDGDSVILSSSSQNGNTWSNGLTSQNIIVDQSGNYSVSVFNGGCTSNSNSVAVTVLNNNFILVEPASQIEYVNDTAYFTVLTINPSLNYQWQSDIGFGYTNLSNAGQYSGVITSVLMVKNVNILNNQQNFRCIISDGLCQDSSVVVSLSVINNLGLNLPESSKKINIYPNPTSSEITITSEKFSNEVYTVCDQMGRVVKSGKLTGTNTIISFVSLSKGIYLLKVAGDYEAAMVVKE